jgi:hypothetical protein
LAFWQQQALLGLLAAAGLLGLLAASGTATHVVQQSVQVLTMATATLNKHKPGAKQYHGHHSCWRTMYHHSHFLRSKIRRTSFLADKLMG